MKLTKKQIEEQLAELRDFIDNSPELESRVAYAIECAVRYVTIDTKDWPTLIELAEEAAELIKHDR